MLIRLEKATDLDLRFVKDLLSDEELKIKNLDAEMRLISENMFVAKNMGNESLGCIYFKLHNSFWYKIAEIKYIVVKKQERKKEIAKEILKEAEKIAIQKGCLIGQTAVKKGDKPAEKLLKSQKWKKGMYFYCNGETYYTYQKNLTGEESWLNLKRFSK